MFLATGEGNTHKKIIPVLLLTAKDGRQPMCPSVRDGPDKVTPKPSGNCQRKHGNLLHEMEDYSARKGNETVTHAITRMNLGKIGSSHRINLWEAKEASYKRSPTISFYLYKLSRMEKSRSRK